MITVTPQFKDAMERPIRFISAYLTYTDTDEVITQLHDEDFIKTITFTPSVNANGHYFGNFITNTMEAEIIDKNLQFNFQLGETLRATFQPEGVETVTYPTFYITERTFDTVNLVWRVKARDKSFILDNLSWIEFLSANPVDWDEGITYAELFTSMATFAEIAYAAPWFADTDYDFLINSAPNFRETTSLRQVMASMAQSIASNVIINANDEIAFKSIVNTPVYTITADMYSQLKINKTLDAIEQVNLSRFPVEGNDVIFPKDIVSGQVVRIENNAFLDREISVDTRSEYVEKVYELFSTMNLSEYQLKWRDVLWIEPGDVIEILNKDDNTSYKSIYTGIKQRFTGGLGTDAELSFDTRAVPKPTLQSLIKTVGDTQIYVDQVNGRITQLATATEEQISEQNSAIYDLENRIESTANETIQTIRRIGGANYIEDSAWYKMLGWDISGDFSVQHDTQAELETECDAILNLAGNNEGTKPVEVVADAVYTLAFRYQITNTTTDGLSKIDVRINESNVINVITEDTDEAKTEWVEAHVTFNSTTSNVTILITNENQTLRLTDIRLTGTDVIQSWSPYFTEVYSSTMKLDSQALEFSDAQATHKNVMDADSNVIFSGETIVSEVSDERHYGQSGEFANNVFIGNMEVRAITPSKILFIRRG